MKINTHADYSDFIKQVEKCSGDVFFDSNEGDHLNLKSKLSQFLLMSVILGNTDMPGGEIRCEKDADYALLRNYLLP